MGSLTSQRTLLLLRHAKAEQGPGMLDHDRELTPRGRKDARAVGEWLRDAGQIGSEATLAPQSAVLPSGAIDLVLCSTSRRTRQTLDEVRAGGVSVKETRFDERIYTAGATGLLDVLLEVPDAVKTVLMIGHGPGVPMLAAALAREDDTSADASERLAESFPTAGTAVFGLEAGWSSLAPDTAYLREFVVPRG